MSSRGVPPSQVGGRWSEVGSRRSEVGGRRSEGGLLFAFRFPLFPSRLALRQDYAEADVEATISRIAVDAGSRAATAGKRGPTSTTRYPAGAAGGSLRIGHASPRETGRPPVLHPFPNVSIHVAEPPRVGQLLPDGMRLAG